MRVFLIGMIVTALTAASVPAARAAAAPTGPQDLHGTWQLNEDLTARMRESERQQEGRPAFGGRGGMAGRRPGGLPGGGFEDPPRGGRGPEPSVEALAQITIEQTADKITFTDAAGHQRVFITDNRKVRDEQLPGGPAETRARWDDNGSLVIEVNPDKGPKRTETWMVSNDRKLLYLTVEMQGGPRPGFKIRRAYNAAAPGETKKPETPPG
jgi:hypothetical protein